MTDRFGRLLLLALCLSGSATAAERPVITWVMTAPPPVHFDHDPSHKGVKDEVLEWFEPRLPQYAFETSDAPVLRSLDYLREVDGFCFPGLARTHERESFIAYSKRVLWAVPDRITVSAADAARLEPLEDAVGSVTMQDLLVRSGLQGAREQGRGYAEPIAADLDRYGNAENLVLIPNDADRFAMLVTGRFNWTTVDPMTASWVFRSQFPDFRYRTFAIRGYEDPVAVSFACAKKPVGLQLIHDIDALIDAHGRQEPWQPLYDAWLDPQSLAALRRYAAAHPDR